MDVDDRMEDTDLAPGLLKNAFAPAMDAAASRVACTARPMVLKIRSCFKARNKLAAAPKCVLVGGACGLKVPLIGRWAVEVQQRGLAVSAQRDGRVWRGRKAEEQHRRTGGGGSAIEAN